MREWNVREVGDVPVDARSGRRVRLGFCTQCVVVRPDDLRRLPSAVECFGRVGDRRSVDAGATFVEAVLPDWLNRGDRRWPWYGATPAPFVYRRHRERHTQGTGSLLPYVR